MKSHLFKAAVTIALALPFLGSSALAQNTLENDGCSQATLKGDYAFTVSGTIWAGPNLVPVQREGIAMTHFDGAGILSQVDLVFSNPGAPPPKGTSPGDILIIPTDQITGFHNQETGTYTVYEDCTGTFTINNPPIFDKTTGATISGAIIVVKFVLGDHGRTIHTVVISLIPPGSSMPAPALIRSEGYKLGKVRQDWD